jgi:hypothetical protein
VQKRFNSLIRFIICCSLVSTCTSCSKEIEIDTKGFEKRVVVNSVFNPGDPFFFQFSYTKIPINQYSIITDSIHILLYEDTHKILDTKILSDTLATSIYPSWGSRYNLKVHIEGFDTILASDTVPMLVPIVDATIKQPISIDRYGDRISQASITFSDPPNERNYYELFFVNAQYDYDTKITDPVLLNEGDIPYMPTTYFFSDELFNGQKYTLLINRDLGYGITTKVILRSVSRNYYLYRKYWTRHSFNQTTDESGFRGIIYKGETLPMFNNIVNGYGIFAGYVENPPYTLRKIDNE